MANTSDSNVKGRPRTLAKMRVQISAQTQDELAIIQMLEQAKASGQEPAKMIMSALKHLMRGSPGVAAPTTKDSHGRDLPLAGHRTDVQELKEMFREVLIDWASESGLQVEATKPQGSERAIPEQGSQESHDEASGVDPQLRELGQKFQF